MKGYKAFNSEFQCRDFKFEVGKTYEISGKPVICQSGFHFCPLPLDTLNYYPPTSRFAKVEGENYVGDGDKRCAQKLTVKEELSLAELVREHIRLVSEGAMKNPHAATHGHGAHAATNGYGAHAVTHGKGAHAVVSGTNGHAEVKHRGCIAVSLGNSGCAQGVEGSWLVLAEPIINKVKAVYVDGRKIKANTPYRLKGGRIIKVK